MASVNGKSQFVVDNIYMVIKYAVLFILLQTKKLTLNCFSNSLQITPLISDCPGIGVGLLF